jgi:hypothetical protein
VQVGVDQLITGARAQLVGQTGGGSKPALGQRAAQALLSPWQRHFDVIGYSSQGANPVRGRDGQASQQPSRHLSGGPEVHALQGSGWVQPLQQQRPGL